MSTNPLWLEIFKASLGPAVASLAVVIGFIQWRTAHQKVVLDLFDRRLRVYEAAHKALIPLIQTGKAETKDVSALHAVRADARFLFGSDVNEYLAQMLKAVAEVGYCVDALAGDPDGNERQALINSKYEHLSRINAFYDEFPPLCEQYMKMDQKLVQSPRSWAERKLSDWKFWRSKQQNG